MKMTEKKYESSAETAKRWNITDRRVRELCRNGTIAGAIQEGKLWKIPAGALKPQDGRSLRWSGIPSALRPLVAEIDALKRDLECRRPLTEGELKHLKEAFLVDYTYASNAIEGNTLTPGETSLVLQGITIGEKPLKDHLEAIGHRDAFNYLEEVVRSGESLSERVVKELHYLVLMANSRDRGAYRRIPVIITGAVHVPPQPYLVAPMMESLVRDLLTTKLHPLAAAAEFHLRFEAIHPFIDGNGRTGRLLANFILMKAGYLPVSIKYENRRAYYNAFTSYHEGKGMAAMLEIILAAEKIRLESYLNAIAGGDDFCHNLRSPRAERNTR